MKIDVETNIAAHAKRNEELKRMLRSKGVEFNTNQSIELHFWAFKRQEAVMLAKALYDEGLIVLALAPLPDDDEGRWNVEAGIKETVEHLTTLAVVRKFAELAAQFNAIYDGWGMSL